MIPEEQWTKNQREFVGTTFKTPKGGILTVVGVYGRDKKGRAIFALHCTICSEDNELYNFNLIKSVKQSLICGSVPCGCSNSPNLTEDQYKIKVKKECIKRGYIFHGFTENFRGNLTKLDLENPRTFNRWRSTSIRKFLTGRGDPIEGRERIKQYHLKEDSYHISDFYKAGFTEDYKFWRSDRVDGLNRKIYWNYTCPHCSSDEYVKNGLCSGVFEVATSTIKRGDKSCRCAKSYRWTQEQREYQINKICKEEGLTFIGWGDRYKNADSKFKWVCEINHNCSTSIAKFLSGRRCKTCFNRKQRELGYCNGYCHHRKDEEDFLYIMNFNNKYVKVGRAFDIEKRINKKGDGLLCKSKVKRKDIKILQVFTSNHQTIYDTEQWLHEELRERCFEYNEDDGLWSIELFSTDCLDVLNYLLKQVDLEKVK